MTQHPSSPTPSSNPVSSAPSTPTVSSPPKKPIYYSRAQLLALHDSPLCVRPPDLKPLAEWFGECDLSNAPKTLSNHSFTNLNLSSNQRSSQLTSPDANTQQLAPSATGLPLLGRGQPPARNPFANFGKFGAEEFNANPFTSSNLNGSNHSLNNPIKGARRIIDRDGAPHIGRGDNQTNESNRRRPNDPSIGSGHKDRISNQKVVEDQPLSDSKSNNRRMLDRYVPDRDRDDDRLRNRERERERDSEREKIRRLSLNPRDGPGGDEPMNWRRSPSGAAPLQLNNNKRNPSDHHSTNSRGDEDTHDSREPSHREKVREKILNSSSNSHLSHRNSNQHGFRETKENGDSHSPSSQLASSTPAPSASKTTPPISPDVPVSSSLRRRVKDGAWDWGQGKWEISKPANGLQNGSGHGSNEADAIQTWKAEMKALEAKKKLAAAATLSAQDDVGDRTATLQYSLEAEDHLPNSSPGTSDTRYVAAVEVQSKFDGDSLSDPSFTLESTPGPSHKQFGFSSLANSSPADPSRDSHSRDVIENELTVLPRASRFAKFFDHHKHDGPQSASFSKTDNQSDVDSPTKAAGSPSADPENMARVLSMLQMSSKQNLEPAPDSASNPKPFPFSNKLETSNGQHSLHNNDLAGFLQPHNTSPTFSQDPAIRSASETEPKNRSRMLDDHTLGQPHANNLFAQTLGENSTGNLPGSQSVGVSSNQPFNLFTTVNHPSHAKNPNETGSGVLRNQGGLEAQMFQLQHMLHSVNNPNHAGSIPAQQLAQERLTENQKLAFLTRHLHQQRVSPGQVMNQVAGVNSLNSLMSLNPTSSALLSNNRQGLNQFEHQQSGLDYQRVPIVASTPAGNGAPHTLQHLNSGTGPNAIFQLPPANAPHSPLNNLFLPQQAPAHHPAIIPPAVNFASPSTAQTAIGNVRPGPANFAHQAPQIIPGLQHHPINHHQQLQLQQQQLQRLQRQQGLPGGTFANHTTNSNMNFPFMGGPTNRGFGPGFGIVPLINNPMGANSSGQQQPPQSQVQQPSPSPLTNTSGLPGFQSGGTGLTHPYQQHQLGNLPTQSASHSQAHSVHSQLDLMSLLNAGNQRRIGM